MKFHPLAGKYDLMPDAELAILIQDMKANGFDERFPIYLYEQQILDGRNRWLAAAAGVNPSFAVFEGTKEQAKAFVKMVNEHRRHLSQEWLKKHREERIERVVDATLDGQTTREIAKAEGVSQKTVVRDLSSASESPDSKLPNKRKPKEETIFCTACETRRRKKQEPVDGKCGLCAVLRTAAAKREKNAHLICERCKQLSAPVVPCGGCDHLREHPPKVVKTEWQDDEGNEIPPRLIPLWKGVDLFKEAARKLLSASKAFKAMELSEAGQKAKPVDGNHPFERFSGAMKNISWRIKNLRPAVLCCKCEAKGCDRCGKKGWLTVEESR